MNLGIEINSANISCPSCPEQIKIDRRYFEPGEAGVLECRYCQQRVFVGTKVSTNINDFAGEHLWQNLKQIVEHDKKE
jgi:DNA-directed RNA polymerase subunit RPC12/RpoP